ncbi:hypothetical protein VPNG_08857 [Cytospora leucostoma]|uniref:Uncharacterized protein n=1 Tax=Cytospora leucostoma TaxID=1230097 RepID=A0A423VRH3_9PEZI|nr:hypothetical protein VPNG_08857 [Cytospora leucostoma]
MQDTSRDHSDGSYAPSQATEASKPSPENDRTRARMRYNRSSLWVSSLFAIILVLPWLIDCVLMSRLLSESAHHQRAGLSSSHLLTVFDWKVASTVLSKVQAVLAVPVISGLLAQAAVVYSQRRSPDQKLSIRQLMALADRSWAGIPGYWRARRGDVGSRLVWVGGVLILFAAVQPPLQSILAGTEPVRVVTCHDKPVDGCKPRANPKVVGYDPEPSYMQYLPSIIAIQKVSSKIMSVHDMDLQPHIWNENWTEFANSERQASTLAWYYPANVDYYAGYISSDHSNDTYFVSSLPGGTNTGVLRQLSMRMNSTSGCTNVPRSDFPTTCSGKRPFTSTLILGQLQVSICAPGASDESPWTLSRDRQDITEDLWIDVFVEHNSKDPFEDLEEAYATNFTLHCTTHSTKGYFELPNSHTNNSPGPLLDTWPSVEEMERDWNDYSGPHTGHAIPTVVDNYTNQFLEDTFLIPNSKFDATLGDIAPGPLMLSTLAMFGNNSWWYAAQNTSSDEAIFRGIEYICQTGNIPFTTLGATREESNLYFNGDPTETCQLRFWSQPESSEGYAEALRTILYGWLLRFNNTKQAAAALGTATYFANEAVLTASADTNWGQYAKQIYASDGSEIFPPYHSLAGLIVISIFVFIQLAALIYLEMYILSTPVWTDTLNSFAMARIGADMERRRLAGVGPLRYAGEEDLAVLKGTDGLIGVVEAEHRGGNTMRKHEEFESDSKGGIDTGNVKQTAPPAALERLPILESGNDVESGEHLVLGVGGSGIISKDLARKATYV